MVRDDLQACLQAYQFAELVLGGLEAKPRRERLEAISGAQRLRDEVKPRHEAASASQAYEPRQLEALNRARERLAHKLDWARKAAEAPEPH